ncbi:carboxypeptidase-like regulatory domain-containing protein [Epilithonimonas sp.]|uniref:carboxypeptidase-like regulatory domain-containing protein n=1 Tax=Epilithonimonas sp. TaxID=2894511 RepID=UPI00289707D0|nr:carboxypeptidase-like regulatory domain-containing protein [Epilithonimonas sp.]
MKTQLTLLFLSIFCISNSQVITGKILSSESKQAIAYARIGVDGENIGAIANETGIYKIDLTNVDKSKKVTVQLGGYYPFEQSVQNFINSGNHNITLKEKVTDIAEVKLSPKIYENKNWGINTKAKKVGFWYSSNGGSEANMLEEVAIFFSNRKKVKLEKINVNINQFTTDKPVVLNFNIYSNENNRPGQSILSENLSVKLTEDQIKDGTFTYDVSDKSIWIDKESFYVSVQIMSGFKGKIGLSAALLSTVYLRSYYDKWQKIPVGAPAINVDVKIAKDKKIKA